MTWPRGHGSVWIFALVLLGLAGSSRRTPASSLPRKNATNPRTGKPIVTMGSRVLSAADIRALVVAHGARDVDKAVAIAQRESSGHPDVIVDTRGMTAAELAAYWGKPALPEYSAGLWQINVLANRSAVPGAQTDEQAATALQDPNIAAAAMMTLSQGGTSWGPWGG